MKERPNEINTRIGKLTQRQRQKEIKERERKEITGI